MYTKELVKMNVCHRCGDKEYQMNQLEREIECLDSELERGEISSAEYTKEYNLLLREYRYAAEEAAQQAYDEELSRW
jgi:hypothetical protein